MNISFDVKTSKMAEFSAFLMGTNHMGGIPCSPPTIIANAKNSGVDISEMTIIWTPNEDTTTMKIKVDSDNNKLDLFPHTAFDGSIFQFQRVGIFVLHRHRLQTLILKMKK